MALIGLILVGWLQLHMIYDILLHTIGTSSGIYSCCIHAGSLFKVTLLLLLFSYVCYCYGIGQVELESKFLFCHHSVQLKHL